MTKSKSTKKVVKGHNKAKPVKAPCMPMYGQG
jgi:hypothetical protein